MTRLFGIVQAAVSLHLAAVLVFAEEKLVGRLFLGHVLVGHVQHRITPEVDPEAARNVVALVDARRIVILLPVLEHRIGITAAQAHGKDRQGTHFDACPQGIRTFVIILELGLVRFGVEIGAFGHVLHTDAVVPLAFVVDRHDGEVAERVRSAEQQPRRRYEIPAVAADIVLPRRRIEIILVVFRFIIDQVRFDVGTVTAVEPVVGRRMERHTHTQAGHGAHDDTRFEIHAAAVDLRFLIEAHVIELRIERSTVLVDRIRGISGGIEITVLFLIGHAHLLVDAAYADRGSDINDIVEIGPHRNGEFVDRALAHDIHRVPYRSVAADAVGHPLPAYVADQIAVIAEDSRPVPGIVIVAQITVLIRENPILPELLPEDIGDGRHQLVGLRRIVTRLRGERIAGIEIRDTVHADTERKARERAGRTLKNIERHTDVGKSEAGLVIAHPRRRALRLAMGDRQQRRE